MRFYGHDAIEALAEKRLAELQHLQGAPLRVPIPIDLVGERVLGLRFLWDEIDELPGEAVLGAIQPSKRLIILNERRKELFDEKPGLERSTKGHEMGHWDLFVDESTLHHPLLFEAGEDQPFAYRSSGQGDVVVLKRLLQSEEGQRLLRSMARRADDPVEASAVNRYSAALSMPAKLVAEEVRRIDRTRWSDLYRLRERFDVTISALVVRLQQLGLLHVTADGELFHSRHEAAGQRVLHFG